MFGQISDLRPEGREPRRSLDLTPGRPISGRVLEDLGNNRYRIQISGQTFEVRSTQPLSTGQSLRVRAEVVKGSTVLLIQELPAEAGVAAAVADPSLTRTAGIVLANLGLEPTPALHRALAALVEWELPVDVNSLQRLVHAVPSSAHSNSEAFLQAAWLLARGIQPSPPLLETISPLLEPTGPNLWTLPGARSLIADGVLNGPELVRVPVTTGPPSGWLATIPPALDGLAKQLPGLLDQLAHRAATVIREDPQLAALRQAIDLLTSPVGTRPGSSERLATALATLLAPMSSSATGGEIPTLNELASFLTRNFDWSPSSLSEELTHRLGRAGEEVRAELLGRLTRAETELLTRNPLLARLAEAHLEGERALLRIQVLKVVSPVAVTPGEPPPTLVHAGEWGAPPSSGKPDERQRVFVYARRRPRTDDREQEDGTAYLDLQMSSLERLAIFIELSGSNVSIRIDVREANVRSFMETQKQTLADALEALDLSPSILTHHSTPLPPPEQNLATELDRLLQTGASEYHGIDIRI